MACYIVGKFVLEKNGEGTDLQEEKVFDSLKTPQPVVKDKIRGQFCFE
jgi:hypothetical protein